MTADFWAAFFGAVGLIVSTAIGVWAGRGVEGKQKESVPDWEGYTRAIQGELAELRQRCDEQDEKIMVLQEEYGSLKRLFRLSMGTLSDWIRWDRLGRRGDPPILPAELEGHL